MGRIVHGHHVGGCILPTETPESHPHLFVPLAQFVAVRATPIPAAVDYSVKSIAAQADDLGNTLVGDCVIAGPMHLDDAMTSYGASPVAWGMADALARYREWTGYDGSPASDKGTNPLTMLANWQTLGLDGEGKRTIAGYVLVDPTNKLETQQAISELGGGIAYGSLDDEWLQEASAGAEWQPGTGDPKEGHCVAVLGYDAAKGVLLNTWGILLWMSWPAFAQFAATANGGGFFAVLDPDWVHDSEGFDLASLTAAFTALGGAVSPPAYVNNAGISVCRGCGNALLAENAWMTDGCPCNSPFGVNA